MPENSLYFGDNLDLTRGSLTFKKAKQEVSGEQGPLF